MVTDYSSAMFDFAITGKPLLFFTYDLPHYREKVRGLYFELGQTAPGPVLERQEDLADALLDLSEVQRRYHRRYGRFQHRFGRLADGRATERVLDLVLPQDPTGTVTGRDVLAATAHVLG